MGDGSAAVERPAGSPSRSALRALAGQLSAGALLDDADALVAYASDASPAEPVVPVAAVLAASVADVQATMAWASEHRVPVSPRGAGTGKAGGCIPSPGGLVLSLAALSGVRAVYPEHGFAEVDAGVITGPFRDAMAARGLFYPPDPNSLDTCTLGGNAATNAGGPVALKYGVTARYVMGVDAVLADGSVLETGRRQPKGVAGYDLSGLLVGSEGTLAVITGLRLALLPAPAECLTAFLPFASVADAAAAVAAARLRGVNPRALELVDGVTLARIRPHADFPVGADWGALLLAEFDGAPGQPLKELERFVDDLGGAAPLSVQVATSSAERYALWQTRRQMSKLVKLGTVGYLSEDIAVPVGSIPALCATLPGLGERHRLIVASYGHAGDGNLHVNLLWAEPSGAERVDGAVEELLRTTLDLGGTITGEHGVGTLKRPYLPWERSPTHMKLQRALKAQFDPLGILNPGKVLA